MSTRALAFDDWMNSVQESMDEVVTQALGTELRPGPPARDDEPTWGAYIPLMTSRDAVRVGVIATPAACEVLARQLAQNEDDDGPLPSADVADAMCELVNMVAGVLKRNVAHKLPSLRIGLPLFVTGKVMSHRRNEMGSHRVQLGSVEATIAVVRYLRED